MYDSNDQAREPAVLAIFELLDQIEAAGYRARWNSAAPLLHDCYVEGPDHGLLRVEFKTISSWEAFADFIVTDSREDQSAHVAHVLVPLQRCRLLCHARPDAGQDAGRLGLERRFVVADIHEAPR